jgi:hypothetical protein
MKKLHSMLTQLLDEVEGIGVYSEGYRDALRYVLEIIEEEAWEDGIDLD